MEDAMKYYKASALQIISISLSAIIISFISANNSSSNILGFILYFIIYCSFFLMLFFITIGAFSVINSSVKTKYGKGFILGAVVHGFMLLFPFAVLLLISEEVLKWNAFQTIVATSIITSVSYCTNDLIRLGGSKVSNTILSLVIGITFLVLFILLSSDKLFN